MTSERPRTEDFRTALHDDLREAELSGLKELKVRAGDLHRKLGVYPRPGHRMPTCCDVMRGEMTAGDEVVASPPKGHGASLTIRYRLPRPN